MGGKGGGDDIMMSLYQLCQLGLLTQRLSAFTSSNRLVSFLEKLHFPTKNRTFVCVENKLLHFYIRKCMNKINKLLKKFPYLETECLRICENSSVASDMIRPCRSAIFTSLGPGHLIDFGDIFNSFIYSSMMVVVSISNHV